LFCDSNGATATVLSTLGTISQAESKRTLDTPTPGARRVVTSDQPLPAGSRSRAKRNFALPREKELVGQCGDVPWDDPAMHEFGIVDTHARGCPHRGVVASYAQGCSEIGRSQPAAP
jgi:hypothetical protein